MATAAPLLRGPGSPFKRCAEKISAGSAAKDAQWGQLTCRALADCVVASAAPDAKAAGDALASLRTLLASGKVECDYTPGAGDAGVQGTPLYLAAKLGLAPAAEILLDHGARAPPPRASPRADRARLGDEAEPPPPLSRSLARALARSLSQGASLVHTFEGVTPLEIAITLGHADVVALFLARVQQLHDDEAAADGKRGAANGGKRRRS